MAEYDTFVNSVHDQIVLFKERQTESVAREEARYADSLNFVLWVLCTRLWYRREAQSLHEWQQRKNEEQRRQNATGIAESNGRFILFLITCL